MIFMIIFAIAMKIQFVFDILHLLCILVEKWTLIGMNRSIFDVIFIIFLLIYIGHPSYMTAGKG